MSVDRSQLSAETLSRLLLLQGMIGHLPDDDAVFGLVARGLEDLPGVDTVRHESATPASAGSEAAVFPVEIAHHSFGAFVVRLAGRALFEPYEPYVRNLCFMVAVVLAERRQRAANVAQQHELERRVEERTRQLAEEAAVRRVAEQRAVAERERAERYLDVAEVIIVELDAAGRIQLINARGCALLGRAADELVGRDWFEVALPAAQRDEVRRSFAAILSGEERPAEYYDNDVVDVHGRRYHIAWHNVFRRDDQGRALGTLSSGLDVSERELAERELSAEKEHLAVTLRSIGDAVVTTDTAGKVVLMNAVAERLTGYSQAEAAGRPLGECFRIVHEQTRAPCADPVQQALASNGVVEVENHALLVARNGREYPVADSAAPIRAQDGTVRGVVLVFRDMTERHRLMEVARRTERLESLGILAGGIAHDFNNLLGGIYGFLDLARLQNHDPRVEHSLAEVAATIERARGLTRQMLTFAKGGSPVRRAGALRPVVEEAAHFALSGSNVSSRLDLPHELSPCAFDAAQIGQVIDNLVINAVQAMPEGGSIEIRARDVSLAADEVPTLPAGPYVRLEVSDSGIGIPPALLSRIFDPFFTTKATGSGLGLATAFSIVKRHDGTILVASEPGRGTTFTVYLPAQAEQALPAPAPPGRSHEGRGSVLVMDDEPALLNVEEQLLASLGYSVLKARDGAEAVETFLRATEGPHDVVAVILDLTVPGAMGGREAAAIIRKRHPTMPIFVASGYAHDPVLAAPERHGFTDALAKPFVRDDLAALLQKHVPDAAR